MASRTDWLTEVAQPVAKKLAQRSGSLKMVMSAAILLLKECTPEVREYYMAKAAGADLSEIENPDEAFRNRVSQIVRDTIALGQDKKSARRSKKGGA